MWTHTYPDVQEAIGAAAAEIDAMRARGDALDEQLISEWSRVGGVKYAAVLALAWRQVLAGLKTIWATDRNASWTFLKEISTNGDMSTVDVIFPSSPMLLHAAPELLRQLLLPVLAYAHNETYVQFSDPYSPHQLGTYPIANAPTKEQV